MNGIAYALCGLVLCVPGLAVAVDDDTQRQVAVTALLVMDWGQTLDMTDQYGEYEGEYAESNPLLGRYPSRGRINTYFVSVIVGHYLIGRMMSANYRKGWQWGAIVLQGYTVSHNFRAGLHIDF